MAGKKMVLKDWLGMWLDKQPDEDVITESKVPLLSRKKVRQSCSRDTSPFSLARQEYPKLPTHAIEYEEPKGKDESAEERGQEEEKDDSDDKTICFASECHSDDKFSRTMDRHSHWGNAIGLLYCPSSETLEGSSIMMAPNENLLFNHTKYAKKDLKAMLEDEEGGREGFRSRGSTIVQNYEAPKPTAVRNGFMENYGDVSNNRQPKVGKKKRSSINFRLFAFET